MKEMEEKYELAKWLAGEMTEAELAAFRETPEYAAYAKIAAVSSKFEAPAFDQEKIYRTVINTKTEIKVIPLYNRIWFRAASIVVILLGIGLFMKSFISSTVSADNGEQSICMLPDNSRVTLNAGSEICYKTWNWDNDRKIDLQGEAYFRVAKGKKFQVKTQLGTVSVLGTQFDVKARGDRFDVTCYEGRVRVDYNHTTVVITRGQHIAFAAGNAISIPDNNVSEPEWLHDEIAFQKENLKNIISELARQYNINIELKTEAKQLFTGTIPLKNIDEAMQILTSTFHLKALKQDGRIILVAVNGPQ
jgi:transmembrane sensor